MSKAVKYAFIFATLFAVLKTLIYVQEWHVSVIGDLLKYAGITLFLLIAVFLSVYDYIKTVKDTGILSLFKEGLKAAAMYTLIVGVFTYVYYENIHPEFVQEKRQAYLENIQNSSWDDVVKKQPELRKLYDSKEAFIQGQKEGVDDVIYSTKFTVSVTLLGLILLGFFYAFFVSIVFKKILLR